MELSTIAAPEPSVSADLLRTEAQRRARIRLLKDLVQNGLYRIDTEQLADKLIQHRVDLL